MFISLYDNAEKIRRDFYHVSSFRVLDYGFTPADRFAYFIRDDLGYTTILFPASRYTVEKVEAGV